MSSVEGLRADIVWEANTGQAIADLGAVGEEYSRTTGAMSDQALRLAAAQDRLTASIQRAGPESRSAKVATLAYRNELAALTAELNNAAAASTRQAEAQARASRIASDAALKNQLAAARTVGHTLTTYVTIPTALVGAAAVKMAFDFETATRLIQTQAGATTGEVDRMRKGILDLVKSGNSFGQTAADMAKGLYPIESEGVRDAKALEILKVAAAGAAVGQTDLAQTANALTSAMQVYKLGAGEAAATMATLNGIVGAGKLHMEDLNAALSTKLLPTAASLGIPLDQIGAAIDVFTRVGPGATTSATALGTALIKFLAPTSAASRALGDLGLNADELGNQLQRGGLAEALATLSKAYEHMVATQGKAAAGRDIAAAFGGSKGGQTALLLVQQYGSYLQSLGRIQKQNSPTTFWNNVAATMHEPAEKVKEDVARVTASLVDLGNKLAPLVATAAGDIDSLVTAFEKLPGPVKDGVAAIVIGFAVGGPVLKSVVGTVVAVGKIGKAFGLLPKIVGPAVAKTDAEVASVGTTAGASGAEADAAFAGVGASADRAAGQVELLVVQEGRIGKVAITSGVEAEGAFAGMRLAAVRALGPIAVLLGAVLALNELQNAVGSSGPSTHGAKPNRPKVFEKNGQYYESVLTPRGVEYIKISKQQARQIQQDVPYDVPKTEPSPRGAQAQRDALRRRDRQRHRRRDRGQTGGEAFTTDIPIGLQVALAQDQYRGDKAAERRDLEREQKFLEAELRKARRAHNKQEELQALQALQGVKDQLSALSNKGSTTASHKHADRYTQREAKLDAQVTDAQAAEQSATTVRKERAAYERERKARLLLLALYEREAKDRSLTVAQRSAAVKKAAAERKALAKLQDDSRQQELQLAVTQAENAVAAATVGSKAYDRAIAAERKALEREIAYDKARANNAKLSLAARQKALEEELAAKKQKAALDKRAAKSGASARQNEAQFLSEFAHIVGAFGPNAVPLDPHSARMATHLYELVQESRQMKSHLSAMRSSGRSPASSASADRALAVTG